MSYTSEAIRNIALIGHAASGKTTLAEALLYEAGVIGQMGSVEKGNTVCDYDPQEKVHQHSLETAIVQFDHDGAHINLLDTPGFPDFMGHAIDALSAVETAAIVINAQTGIETMTRRMMEHAQERGLCRMIIINKIDQENIDLSHLVAEIQQVFGNECLPINLPTDNATAVVDCFFNKQGNSDFVDVAEAHTAIIDQVVEINEELMESYLEMGDESVDPDQLHNTFEQVLREGHLIPICFVSARNQIGVQQLLELCVKLLPSPLEGNAEPFYRGEDESPELFYPTPYADAHAIAHVFRLTIDPFVGKLAAFRVHQGTITKDSQLFIGDARKPFKINHLLRIHGKDTHEMQRAIPGDICAVAKVDEIYSGAVIHDSHDEDHVHLQALHYPVPLFGLALSPQNRGDEQKMSDTLNKLTEEDPCLLVEHNQATRETVLRGLSELHLRLALERMRERYRLEVNTRPPKIAYRESIRSMAEGHHRHKKQTGGAGQFGEVFLRVEPLEQGAGFEFASEVVGGAIPTSLIPAVEKGIRDALQQGAVAGYPIHDVRVVVYDGKHHPVDSKEVAFSTAGREAFFDAMRKAKPVVLEPMVRIQIEAPADAMGALAGDLSSRRGRVNGSEMTANDSILIDGLVPLAEIDGYASQLTSLTGGAGSYSIEYSHYDPVPADIQKRLCEAYQSPETTQ